MKKRASYRLALCACVLSLLSAALPPAALAQAPVGAQDAERAQSHFARGAEFFIRRSTPGPSWNF